ncbi:MAG: hypothetical protein WDN06_17730 [Asticcacaulis sp.]
MLMSPEPILSMMLSPAEDSWISPEPELMTLSGPATGSTTQSPEPFMMKSRLLAGPMRPKM